jgi:hypothetical protein
LAKTKGGKRLEKNKKAILLALFFFSVFLPPAQASVNSQGIDGLINVPSAYVRQPWKAGVGYFCASGDSLLAGNLSVPGGVELAYKYRLGERGFHSGNYSVKIALLQEKILSPALAVGAEDLTGENRRAGYLAMSKQGPWGVRLHLGAKTAGGFFYGLERQIKLRGDLRKMLPFMPLFTLMLEYDGHNFNYGAYARNSRGVRIDLAWRGLDNKFMIGAQKEF